VAKFLSTFFDVPRGTMEKHDRYLFVYFSFVLYYNDFGAIKVLETGQDWKVAALIVTFYVHLLF